jgi:hypothetical protein
VSDHRFWAAQSLITEPGPAAAAIDRLPSDLGALRAASQQLVFHYWADGDYAANGIAPERISEIDTRYAAAMFARLGELADLPLSAARQPSPPLTDLRSAYRRPEFVVPDTVTTYSPARTDIPAVVDVSAVARAAS